MNGKKARQKRHEHRGVRLSGPYAEAARDRDRVYFAAHPGQDMYVRQRMAGEFGPRDHHPFIQRATHVRVSQLGPDIRLREPMMLLLARDYPAGQIPFEHLEAFVDQSSVADPRLFVFDTRQLEDE